MSPDLGDLTGLDASSQAFTRTVDALTADELAAPSLLPGWTRAHVVAHVALNGSALAAVVSGLVHDNPVAMYESDAQRDDDIERLAAAEPSDLRDRHLVATTEFADAVGLMEESHWSGRIDRLPGGPAWPMATVVPTRRRELEIHHVDLGTSYTRADWSEDFLVQLLDAVTVDHAEAGPFRVRASDLGRDWPVGGDGGPTVIGSGADLGWWLTGRGSDEGLSTDAGELPWLGPWRRA
ncbi:MAG: maleylpyruvate isomerase family mycothiol-dependent enzyme [Marmoricola sp.]|nr:maleylpyruvate isomerase family mycothiol-dependent enzyme [Marmoricola sp.]